MSSTLNPPQVVRLLGLADRPLKDQAWRSAVGGLRIYRLRTARPEHRAEDFHLQARCAPLAERDQRAGGALRHPRGQAKGPDGRQSRPSTTP